MSTAQKGVLIPAAAFDKNKGTAQCTMPRTMTTFTFIQERAR